MTACTRCGRASERYRVRMASGWAVGDWCDDCDRPADTRRMWLPRSLVGDPMRYPERSPRSALDFVEPTCAVCGAQPTEEHHWAPSALFGDESARWPTAHLCHACHTRWHATVWPGGGAR